MSEAPKTIEVDTHEAEYLCAVKFHDPQDDTPTTIYRRADLPPTREQIMADPRVMALVEALKSYACKQNWVAAEWNGLHGPRIPALTALEAAETDNEGETE